MRALAFIGSAAIEYWGLRKNAGLDMDVIGDWDSVMAYLDGGGKPLAKYPTSDSKWVAKYETGIVEAEIAWAGSTGEELLRYVVADPETRLLARGQLVPSIHVLLALKLSHRYLRNSPHFLKTMHDIWLLRRGGAEMPQGLRDWLTRREAETYSYGHPKLNVSKANFFKDDGVKYVYDHDDIHQAIKHLPQPAYTYFKADGEEVLTSKAKFMNCARETQLYAVLEEAYVLAIERALVPFPGVLTPREAFLKALEKVCTSITSGWFREFAWENYFDVDALYQDEFWYRFQQAVKLRLVRPHRGLPGTSGPAG